MANPFENIFTNLFRNSVFAPPRAVQGAERAAALEAEASAAKQAQALAQRQSLMRGLQGVAEITGPGALTRQEVVNQVLSNPKLMEDLIVKGGLEKPEDFLKIFEGLTAKPFEQTGVSPGEVILAPSPLGQMEEVFRNPTTEQKDTQDKQVQAAARAKGIGMLSQWLGKGLPRTQVFEKANANKEFIEEFYNKGMGKPEDLKTLLELGTTKPLEPTTLSPGEGIQLPNADNTGFVPGPQQPTSQTQLYTEIETKHGPEVAKWLFDNAGPNMNPTEKQVNLRELIKRNPGNKELENIARKVDLGLIVSEAVLNPMTGKMEPSFRDYTKVDEATSGAPVARPRSPDPSVGMPPASTGQQPQAQPGATGQQPPFVPQFTPPKPSELTMKAGEAAFEFGPPGSVQSFFNNVLAPAGFAKTNIKREEAEAAFGTLADVTREYFQNSGRPLAADVQQVISRLPKTGSFTKGFFQTPLKTLSQLKSLRGQIEREMDYWGRLIAKANSGAKMSPELVQKAQMAFTNGELALEYYPTAEEFKVYEERAKMVEAKGPKGVGAEIMKRWNESFQGGQEIQDFLGGEDKKPESLDEKEQRLLRELEALDPTDDQDDPSEMDLDTQGEEEMPFAPGKSDKNIFSPSPVEREKELVDELMELEQQGMQSMPLGDGTFVEPAGAQTVTGANGEPVSIEQRKQEIMEELGVLADQKALHRRRLYTEISSVRAAKQTGLPEEVFHAAAGVQSEIASITALPAAVVRQALVAIGAARLMNPEWQSERSTESLMKDYWQARGNVVDIPEGSISGRIGEGAFIGATLAYGLTVAGSRIAAAKGPKALNFAKERIRKLFAGSKGEATAAGASSGAAASSAGEYAEQSGAGPKTKATVEIAAGILAPGKSLVAQGGRVVNALKRPTTGPKMRPEGAGATMTKEFGKQMEKAAADKAAYQKTVLGQFTAMDADKAIDSVFTGTIFGVKKNPELAMRKLLGATSKNKDAREGVRRGTMDWLFKKSGLFTPQFTPDKFAKVWNDPSNRRAYMLVLPQQTVKRIDAAIAAEMALSTGVKAPGKYKPLAKAIGTGAAIDVVTGSPGLATMLFVGRVMGAQGIKASGVGSTLQTQTAGAEIGKSAFRRLYQKMFPGSIDPSSLFREALLDPKFEATLLKRAGASTAKAERKAAGKARRVRGAVIGIQEAVDDEEVLEYE